MMHTRCAVPHFKQDGPASLYGAEPATVNYTGRHEDLNLCREDICRLREHYREDLALGKPHALEIAEHFVPKLRAQAFPAHNLPSAGDRRDYAYWRIVERVGYDVETGKFLTIHWSDCYGSEAAAEAAIEAHQRKVAA